MLLKKHEDSIRGGSRVYLLNGALSIELLLKAIIVAKGKIAPKHHDLLDLARNANVGYVANQRATLELLTQILKWSGRYPVPNKEEDWQRYYDDVLEKHIIREREANIGRARANPETFPTIDNYQRLWNFANLRWSEVVSGTNGGVQDGTN